jgi:acyl-CoA thioesterase-1
LKRRHFNALLSLSLVMATMPLAWAQAQAPAILVVGDSLSAEYGLQRGTGWITLLQGQLKAAKHPEVLINAGISGDTSAGGRSRLPALLTQHKPTIVVIELGGNDALRGMPLASTQDNLSAMVRASQKAGAQVLLIGMEVPPNYGARYTKDFRELFQTVATQEKTALVPFLLAGVADRPDALALFQADRIHPNETAQPMLAANVWPALQKLLSKR